LFAPAGIGIELRRRQWRLGFRRLIVLRQKSRVRENQIALQREHMRRGIDFKRLTAHDEEVYAEHKCGKPGGSSAQDGDRSASF
jgi:hypothetical protein